MTTPPPGMDIVERLRDESNIHFSEVALCAEAADLITRLRRAAPEWQPISTAPKQKIVLLWAATDIVQGEIRNWKMAAGVLHVGYQGEPDYWEWDGRLLKAWDIAPTHWQPLPFPPSEQAAAVAGEDAG